jgi:hypothetical protein
MLLSSEEAAFSKAVGDWAKKDIELESHKTWASLSGTVGFRAERPIYPQ